MKKTLLFLAVVLMSLSMMAQTTTYTKITSPSQLSAGDKVLLVGFNADGQAFVMSYQKSNNRHAVEIEVDDDAITTTVAASSSSQTEPYELTIGGQPGAWTFFDELNNGYLYAPGGGNYLRTQTTLDNKGEWIITFAADGGSTPVSNGGVEQNIMRYNKTSTLFGCYKESSTTNDLVYIFKGGTPTLDPEPSNYPTNFNASLDITKVTLTWTASTGEQLPRGYVVLGSTEGIEAPVDGIPVVNDTDPSDGFVAYNTNDTDVYFDQLPANTTWLFAIFPYTNSGENIDYKTDGVYPTTSITTGDVTCIFASDFASGLAPFTAINIEGDQEWTTATYDGIPFAKMSGYSSSKVYYPNEDWLITPNILNGNTYESLTIAFMNAYKFDGDALQCLYSTNYDGMSDPTESTFTWTNITNNFEWSAGDYAWANTNYTMNTSGMSALYVAFKYTCSNTAASTWEVADFKVYSGYDAVEENETVSFNLFPNPAESSVNIVAENNANVQIFDMVGRTVMTIDVVEGVNTVSVADLESGVYFVRMNGVVVKFVKR